MAIRFDPRPSVRNLRDTGMSDDTANAVVDVSMDAAEAATTDLATKTDLAEFKNDIYRALLILAGFNVALVGLALVVAQWMFN